VLHPSSSEPDFRAEAFPQLVGLLTASLEQLREAKACLDAERAEASAQAAALGQRIEYERRLFEFAPMALIVTNLVGAITEANQAATEFLGQDMHHLDLKPLSDFVNREDRDVFRAEVERIRHSTAVTTWRLRFTPRRAATTSVVAAVRPVPRGNRFGDLPALFWSIRPV
jgi:PAS domain S-box-containing protein